MAMAWVTRVRNSTKKPFVIKQNDPSWHPIVFSHRHQPDEPINICAIRPKGTLWSPFLPNPCVPVPTNFPSSFPLPSDTDTDIPIDYCVVPWVNYGRLRLEGPKGNLDFIVGPIDGRGIDFLRGLDSNGAEIVRVELGASGPAWASVSYDFHIDISDAGIRWVVWNVNPLGGQVFSWSTVNALSDLLKTLAPLIGSLLM